MEPTGVFVIRHKMYIQRFMRPEAGLGRLWEARMFTSREACHKAMCYPPWLDDGSLEIVELYVRNNED